VQNLLLFAADTLKLPFAVAGVVFVVWAALVAGIGLTRPQFPGGLGGQRTVMAVTVLLAAVVMGIAVQVG
jgi:hypothetical protein